jgi:hypothetical protein
MMEYFLLKVQHCSQWEIFTAKRAELERLGGVGSGLTEELDVAGQKLTGECTIVRMLDSETQFSSGQCRVWTSSRVPAVERQGLCTVRGRGIFRLNRETCES